MKRSKRYRAAVETTDRSARYAVADAVAAIRSQPAAKFDESLEIVVSLGIDPRQSDQAVRSTITLPHGTGKSREVAVFAEGEAAEAARRAGADHVGGAELVEKVNGGWLGFDAAVATPQMMQHVRKLGRVLGPRGLMPSPKAGTVTDDLETAVTEIRRGKIEYRNDDTGNIHAPLGKVSFDEEKLVENVQAFLDHLQRQRPPAAKGRFVLKACLSRSMGPSVRLDV